MAFLPQATTINGPHVDKKGTASCSGTTLTIDLMSGTFFEVDLQSLGGDIATFAFTNYNSGLLGASYGCSSFVLKTTQGSTARQFNWGSLTITGVSGSPAYNFRHIGGIHPQLTLTDNAIDMLSFTYWYGNAENAWYVSTVGFNFQ